MGNTPGTGVKQELSAAAPLKCASSNILYFLMRQEYVLYWYADGDILVLIRV